MSLSLSEMDPALSESAAAAILYLGAISHSQRTFTKRQHYGEDSREKYNVSLPTKIPKVCVSLPSNGISPCRYSSALTGSDGSALSIE